MPERATGKARRASQRVSAEHPRAETNANHVAARGRVSDETEDIVSERDRLKSELDAARARVAELEAQRDQISNHIDWIIDSLHSLLDDEH